MWPVVLGLAVAAAVLAFPFAFRRPARNDLRAGTRPASPVLPAAGEAGRPEPQPRGGVTGPFGYDDGVTIGGGQ